MSGALLHFWDTRGYTRERDHWLREALEKASDEGTSHRCRALLGAGLLCIRLSLGKEATLYLETSLNMARQLGLSALMIRSLIYSAPSLENRADARKRLEEAICTLHGIAPHTAARLLGKAKAIREKEAYGIPLSERHLVEPVVGHLRSQLGNEAFDTVWREEGILTCQQVIETAFEVIKA